MSKNLSLSFNNARQIQNAALFSGYELDQVYARIGKAVLVSLGINPKTAVDDVILQRTSKVTVFVDTLNLNGFLD
jgi:hypothetical protein